MLITDKQLKVYMRINVIHQALESLYEIKNSYPIELANATQLFFDQTFSLLERKFFFLSNIISIWVIDHSPEYTNQLVNLEGEIQDFYNSVVNSLGSTVTTTEPSL